jgi:hypothetical protein
MDHRFHFIEHAIDDDREPRERLVDGTVRQSLAEIAGDDALNPLVDVLDPPLGAHAQPGAGQQAKKKGGQQTQQQRLADDMRDFPGFIDIPPNHQHVAVVHAPGDRTDDLVFPAVSIHPDDVGALRRGVDPQIGRQAVDIAGNSVTVGGKYRRELYTPRILPQPLLHRLEPPFGRQTGNHVQFRGDHPVGSDRQIVIDLPVDKSEQHDDEDCQHPGHHEGPVEGVRAHELRLTHRISPPDISGRRQQLHITARIIRTSMMSLEE